MTNDLLSYRSFFNRKKKLSRQIDEMLEQAARQKRQQPKRRKVRGAQP